MLRTLKIFLKKFKKIRKKTDIIKNKNKCPKNGLLLLLISIQLLFIIVIKILEIENKNHVLKLNLVYVIY